MTERKPVRREELSEQYLTDWAYFTLIRLAQSYGRDPSKNKDKLDPDLSPLLDEHDRTLKVLIPAAPSQGYSDLISCQDYGIGVIKVFYRRGRVASNLTLSLSEETGKARMQIDNTFSVNKSENGEHPISTSVNPENFVKHPELKPSIYDVITLLEQSKSILETRHRKEILARVAEKVEVRRRGSPLPIAKRIQALLEKAANKLPPA